VSPSKIHVPSRWMISAMRGIVPPRLRQSGLDQFGPAEDTADVGPRSIASTEGSAFDCFPL
jgi:hypothetical protein